MHQTAKHLLSLTVLFILCNVALSRNLNLKDHYLYNLLFFHPELNHYLLEHSGNQFVSVLGSVLDLNLLHLGTNGKSRNEISVAYRIPEDDETVFQAHHESYSELLKLLDKSTLIHNILATGIFVQKGVELKPSYVSQVHSYSDVNLFPWDISDESNFHTDMTHQFLHDFTVEKLQEIFSRAAKSNPQLIIATAHSFSGPFAQPFLQSATKAASFDTGNGMKVNVKMMSNTDYVYYQVDKFGETILLPLADPDFYLMVQLPGHKYSMNASSRLSLYFKLKYLLNESKTLVHYEIPKMKLKWTFNIKSMLEENDIVDVFTNVANLTNMVNDTILNVSGVIQAGELELNENGIGVVAGESSGMVSTPLGNNSEPIKFIANRLFVFDLLYDYGPGFYPLFGGKIVNPNEGMIRRG